MLGDHLSLRDPTIRGDPIALHDSERRLNKGAREDDAASNIMDDSLIILHKKFHFLNDVVKEAPKRFDRAVLPPTKYLIIYETRLRFPPSGELIEISVMCGVSLSQFLHKAMSVTMGLIALFRDRGAILTPKYLFCMG
ncbi:hypothetical protein IEQ34_005173 [Dendrobium chrysotoxum]|uniref:Uncharacterized protein n=1 Tax=Dendrobium chrysotoxum TaxID=161865 RepID=A0AAV7HAC5_DENCH|nr:hypothetical protein IEQ34_005173 [Dendrobium chrysotoxum]